MRPADCAYIPQANGPIARDAPPQPSLRGCARTRDACASLPNPIRERGRPALSGIAIRRRPRLPRRMRDRRRAGSLRAEACLGAATRPMASRSLAFTFFSLTWPKPRMVSGTPAICTASAWLFWSSVASTRLDRGLVFADQAALHAALLGVAEDVELGAAQALQRGEQAERRHHPGAVFALLELAGRRIALGEQRRRQMEGELVVALELRAELLQELAVAVEARRPRTRPCRPSACRATWPPPRRGPSGPAPFPSRPPATLSTKAL